MLNIFGGELKLSGLRKKKKFVIKCLSDCVSYPDSNSSPEEGNLELF